MATKRYTISGYGQLELNNVAFRRDGRIEAQCKPNETNFANKKLENGMILAIDQVAREVKLPTPGSDNLYALNYTAEHMYDERANALKDFALDGKDTFLPRLGYLAVGDKFTTNCVCYDTAWAASDSILGSKLDEVGTTPVYGGIDATGAIALTSTAPTIGPVLNVVKRTTMPDGTFGVKFQVIAD